MKMRLKKYANTKIVSVGPSKSIQITKHLQGISFGAHTDLAAVDKKMNMI